MLTCFVGVEDLENYHGKALGDKGKAAVEKLKEGLSNDKHNLGPQPVVDDAPAVDLSPGTIKLSEPPSYKIGDKVIKPFISKAPSWILVLWRGNWQKSSQKQVVLYCDASPHFLIDQLHLPSIFVFFFSYAIKTHCKHVHFWAQILLSGVSYSLIYWFNACRIKILSSGLNRVLINFKEDSRGCKSRQLGNNWLLKAMSGFHSALTNHFSFFFFWFSSFGLVVSTKTCLFFPRIPKHWDSQETKLTVSVGTILWVVCYIAGNLEAGNSLSLAVMAVVNQHSWVTVHCCPLTS